jgi:hypothetical protein
MIEKNPANGRFQRVTPLTMAARLAAMKKRTDLHRHSINVRALGYTGPLTRADIAS